MVRAFDGERRPKQGAEPEPDIDATTVKNQGDREERVRRDDREAHGNPYTMALPVVHASSACHTTTMKQDGHTAHDRLDIRSVAVVQATRMPPGGCASHRTPRFAVLSRGVQFMRRSCIRAERRSTRAGIIPASVWRSKTGTRVRRSSSCAISIGRPTATPEPVHAGLHQHAVRGGSRRPAPSPPCARPDDRTVGVPSGRRAEAVARSAGRSKQGRQTGSRFSSYSVSLSRVSSRRCLARQAQELPRQRPDDRPAAVLLKRQLGAGGESPPRGSKSKLPESRSTLRVYGTTSVRRA